MRFISKYLTGKYKAEPELLMEIYKSWGLTKTNFVAQVDSWFGNFQESDYDLAFKILKEIDFYSNQRIKDVLKSYRQKIERIVSPKKWQAQDIVLIVPDGYGDSAHRHAYDLSKIWKINRNQIYSISQLNAQAVSDKSILIAFNDTYGTGNQFVTDMASNGSLREIAKQKWLFIVGLTVSDIALNYLQYELPDAHIIRTAAPKTVYEVFNYKEMRRIEELGADVYPPHPLGYGGAGLLVAYEFQCPNNSIPLIWANSITANNEFENYSFPWSPLCEYFPKCKSGKSALTRSSELDIHSGNNITTKRRFSRRTNLEFTDADLELINQTLDKWACSTKTHNEIIRYKLTAWFNNFRSKDKELALKIFSNITYLSLARTREAIKNLRDEVLAMISRMNQTKSDIVLVVTGDDIERNYHYVYDFMRKWGLQLAQVSTLKHICQHPYEVVGKHLVFFHHTRIHRNETFISDIWPRVKELPAKSFHILSFLMSKTTVTLFDKLVEESNNAGRCVRYYYCKSLSRPLSEILSNEELIQVQELLRTKGIREDNVGRRFLTVYYFDCPKDTLSLLWYNKNIKTLFTAK